ncbi:hypothetical protein ABK040_007713 [Willaertia magna]
MFSIWKLLFERDFGPLQYMIDYWNSLDSDDVDSRCSIKMDEESKLKRKVEKLAILMLTNEEEEKDKFWYKINVHKLAFVLSLFDKNGLILKPLGTTNEDAVEKPIKELTKEKVNLVDCLEEDLDLDKIVEDDEEEEQDEKEKDKEEDEEEKEDKEDSEEEYNIKDNEKRKDFFSLDERKTLRKLKLLIECYYVMVGYLHNYNIIPLSRFCYFILCGKENELFKRIDILLALFYLEAMKRDKLQSVAVSPFIEGPFQPFCYFLYLDKKVNYRYYYDPYFGGKYGKKEDVRVENGTPVGKNGFKRLTDKLGCTPVFGMQVLLGFH